MLTMILRGIVMETFCSSSVVHNPQAAQANFHRPALSLGSSGGKLDHAFSRWLPIS